MHIVLYLQGDTTKNDAGYWKQILMKYLKKYWIWGFSVFFLCVHLFKYVFKSVSFYVIDLLQEA
jgi:hypothetical protein